LINWNLPRTFTLHTLASVLAHAFSVTQGTFRKRGNLCDCNLHDQIVAEHPRVFKPGLNFAAKFIRRSKSWIKTNYRPSIGLSLLNGN